MLSRVRAHLLRTMFLSRNIAIAGVVVVAVAIVAVGLIVGLTTRSCSQIDEVIPSTTTTDATQSPETTKPTISPTTEETISTSESSLSTPTPTPRTDLLLPGDIIPSHYTLYLWPELENFTTTGWVDITFKCVRSTKVIFLHSTKNRSKINETTTLVSHKENENRLGIFQEGYDSDKEEFYVIILEDNLTVDEKYVVHLTFNGVVADDLAGLYLSSYTAADNTTKYVFNIVRLQCFVILILLQE